MKLKRKYAAAALAAFCLLLFSGCSGPGSPTADTAGKPVVAVSIVPEATFAGAVCGSLAEIVTAVPPGSSPETYEPTPKEMADFSRAEIYFTIGVPAEAASILPKAAEIKTMKIIKLEDAVSKAYPDRKFESGERDPHIWLSPKRAKVMVQAIAAQMGAADPQHRSEYAANAEKYEKKLDGLSSEITGILAGSKSKTFLVYHPAFGYFADDFGLNMVALEQEGKESTAQHMQQLVDLAKKQGAKAIFYQAETDSNQAQAFANEIGGKTVELAPLAADYSDNLVKMAKTIAGSVESETK